MHGDRCGQSGIRKEEQTKDRKGGRGSCGGAGDGRGGVSSNGIRIVRNGFGENGSRDGEIGQGPGGEAGGTLRSGSRSVRDEGGAKGGQSGDCGRRDAGTSSSSADRGRHAGGSGSSARNDKGKLTGGVSSRHYESDEHWEDSTICSASS